MIGLAFTVINLCLGIFTITLVIRGVRYFKNGLMANALNRAWIPAVAIALFFTVEALVATDILPSNTSIDDILGTIFMFGLLYVAHGFINDWKKFMHE